MGLVSKLYSSERGPRKGLPLQGARIILEGDFLTENQRIR